MQVEYVSRNKQFKVLFDGKSEKDLFEQVAHFQEVFEGNNTCKCGSQNVHFGIREVDGNNYYEKICQDCRSKFSYGQHKQGGTLFPNSSKGWHKWTPSDNAEENEPAPKSKRVKG